jgi:hypothetical protein
MAKSRVSRPAQKRSPSTAKRQAKSQAAARSEAPAAKPAPTITVTDPDTFSFASRAEALLGVIVAALGEVSDDDDLRSMNLHRHQIAETLVTAHECAAEAAQEVGGESFSHEARDAISAAIEMTRTGNFVQARSMSVLARQVLFQLKMREDKEVPRVD